MIGARFTGLIDRGASELLSLGRPTPETGWLIPTETRLVEGIPARLAFRRAEAGHPTCVFLPGYPDTLHVFSPVLRRLPKACGYLAIDFPGQGGSAPRSDTDDPQDRARWLGALIDSLEIGRLRVFGHDMGAHTAFTLSAQRPVERLVLSHALLDPHAPTSASITLLRKSAAYRVLLPAFPELVVTRCLSTFLPPTHPLTEAVERDVRETFRSGGAAHTVKVCDAAEAWLRRPFDARALGGTKPVLLWGEREAHFFEAHALRFGERVPSEQVRVPGGHHWLCWHAPDRVIAVLLA